MRAHVAVRLRAVSLSFVLLGMLISILFPMVHATGQYQAHAKAPMSEGNTFKEPFKDFFDYEWWLPGSAYAGKGRQYGKWFVVEMFWDNGVPRQWFEITKENPISGTDSAHMIIDGSKADVLAMAWRDLFASSDPDRLVYPNALNPAYLRFRFRIDEWVTTDPNWRVTLGALAGVTGYSGFIGQVIIGLEGLNRNLVLRYRTDSTEEEWWGGEVHEVVSSVSVNIGVVHTIEILRLAGTNGEVRVWFDGVEVPEFTVQNIDTSFPGGISTIEIGNDYHQENGFFATGYSPGSRCIITFDDLRVRNQYIGVDTLPTSHYALTLDSSPQGKTVRVGNHIVGESPTTIQVPEGTTPKVGVDPTNFDHWEISPNFDDFSSYSETWLNITTPLIATVTRAPAPPGQNVGPSPTPAIYSDTRITAMYTTGIKHTLNVTSNPVATSFTVDELDYTTPWSDSLTKGTHTISVPSAFIVDDKRYDFRNWEDDSTNPTRTVNLVSGMNITAYYEETTIPEFPTLIAWLTVVGFATVVVVLGARNLRVHSRIHRHLHSE